MEKSLIPAITILPDVESSAYVQTVNSFPLLSLEEECNLAIRLRETGDLEAARQLVMAHLRFVVRIARGYSGYGLPQADLIQEGNIGLMKAVKRFDPDRGVRLVSFAIHWVRAEMHEFVLKNWRIVKMATTKAQRKLFFNLRSARKKLGWLSATETTQLANDLGVSERDVTAMDGRLHYQDSAFDGHQNESADDDQTLAVAPADYLADTRFEPAAQLEKTDYKQQRLNWLHSVLSELDERSRDILQRRWLSEPKATLKELATMHQVSAERIRQLEQQALKKLKAQPCAVHSA